MEKKTVSAIMLTLLLMSMFTLAFNIQPVKAEGGTIYIRADGSVDPPTAPIQRDGDVYTFTDNIYDSIVVERSGVIIDGAGYTVQGNGSGKGFNLSGVSNVTIKNTNINGFILGVYLNSTSCGVISGNNITNNSRGVEICFGSKNNTVYANNIINNGDGVWLRDSSSNTLYGNNITNCYTSIWLIYSSNNTVGGNTMDNNQQGFGVFGESLSDYMNDINASNMIDGEPVYYWVNRQNDHVPAAAGYVGLVNSTNITVKGLELKNNGQGILCVYTKNSTITQNTIRNNFDGIYLGYASDNIISENNITNNDHGIRFYKLSNNKFVHNNFIANIQEVYGYEEPANVWDDGYPSGGNYWSDYTDVDLYNGPYQNETGGDGIWDHPYVIDANNQDRYPLVNPWTPTPPIQTWSFDSDFQYNLDDDYGTIEGTGHSRGKATLSAGNLSIEGQITLNGALPSGVPEVYLIATDGQDKELTKQTVDLSYFSYWQTGTNTYNFSGQISNVIQPINNGHYEAQALITYNAAKYEFFVNTASLINSHYFPLTTPPTPPPNQPPFALFTYTPLNPIAGEEITFNASTSYDPDGHIVNYRWSFGDGNVTTTTDPIIIHTYTATGALTVTLSITDDDGVTDSTSKIILIATTVPNQPPVAFFTNSPESPRAGEETKLDASNSDDPDGEIKFYEWDLDGDGDYDGFTTSPDIYYFWDESGVYSVKLRVTDNLGATHTFVKDINVQQNSLWGKIKKFFASSVETLSESERRRFEIIKSELNIINYPHSDDPSSDPDFYWISDNQLLFVLKKKIDPEASDLTYETLIIDILHDMKLADSVANSPWTTSPEIEKYFQNMAEINAWAEVPVIQLETLLDGIIDLGEGSGIGVGSVLMLWDVCQAGVELKLLDETFYRRALWHYFQLREMDYSPETAFESSPIPIKYDNVATREYFESLWTEYGGPHISDTGGLKQEFKQQIIKQLRTVLLSGLEKYKFEPYHIYRIKSPGELRVYDLEGQVTGLVNSETREDIPNSAYDDESKTIIIFPAVNSYYCQVVGTNEGIYELTITFVENGKATAFSAINLPISVNTIHQYTIDWVALSQGEEGVTVKVDSDGDGVFEHTFTSDSELTQSEFLAQTAPPPLSVSISPLSASILVGQSLTFTSTVSGGYTPYSYQWYLNGAPASEATSNTWTFTPTTSGIYYIHLKVTDAKGNTAQSETARITVAIPPVGGYSFPIQVSTKAEPVLPYIALIAILTAILTKLRPKTKRKR